jgi:hypothetical protein
MPPSVPSQVIPRPLPGPGAINPQPRSVNPTDVDPMPLPNPRTLNPGLN